jgi:hypothetical protein
MAPLCVPRPVWGPNFLSSAVPSAAGALVWGPALLGVILPAGRRQGMPGTLGLPCRTAAQSVVALCRASGAGGYIHTHIYIYCVVYPVFICFLFVAFICFAVCLYCSLSMCLSLLCVCFLFVLLFLIVSHAFVVGVIDIVICFRVVCFSFVFCMFDFVVCVTCLLLCAGVCCLFPCSPFLRSCFSCLFSCRGQPAGVRCVGCPRTSNHLVSTHGPYC